MTPAVLFAGVSGYAVEGTLLGYAVGGEGFRAED